VIVYCQKNGTHETGPPRNRLYLGTPVQRVSFPYKSQTVVQKYGSFLK